MADENEALLIFDEIQTGVGMSGTFWAGEQTGVKPETLDAGVYGSDSLSGDGLPPSVLAGVAGVLTH